MSLLQRTKSSVFRDQLSAEQAGTSANVISAEEERKNILSSLEHGIDAVSTLAVISSFIFAFAFSLWFETPEAHFEDNEALNATFFICISMVVILSGFSTFIMTTHYYLLQTQFQELSISKYETRLFTDYINYVEYTSIVRQMSRVALLFCMFFIYIAMMLFSFNKFDSVTTFIVVVIVFSAGLLCNIWGIIRIYVVPNTPATAIEPDNVNNIALKGHILKYNIPKVEMSAFAVQFDKMKQYEIQCPMEFFRRVSNISLGLSVSFFDRDWVPFALLMLGSKDFKYNFLLKCWMTWLDDEAQNKNLNWLLYCCTVQYLHIKYPKKQTKSFRDSYHHINGLARFVFDECLSGINEAEVSSVDEDFVSELNPTKLLQFELFNNKFVEWIVNYKIPSNPEANTESNNVDYEIDIDVDAKYLIESDDKMWDIEVEDESDEDLDQQISFWPKNWANVALYIEANKNDMILREAWKETVAANDGRFMFEYLLYNVMKYYSKVTQMEKRMKPIFKYQESIQILTHFKYALFEFVNNRMCYNEWKEHFVEYVRAFLDRDEQFDLRV